MPILLCGREARTKEEEKEKSKKCIEILEKNFSLKRRSKWKIRLCSCVLLPERLKIKERHEYSNVN